MGSEIDPENPQSYPSGKKWGVTMIGAVSVLAVTMTSSMMSAAIFEIRADFPGKSNQMYILGKYLLLVTRQSSFVTRQSIVTHRHCH